MNKVAIVEYVRVPKIEYRQFKKLKRHLVDFSLYLEHIADIKKSRNSIKNGLILQTDLFKTLAI